MGQPRQPFELAWRLTTPYISFVSNQPLDKPAKFNWPPQSAVEVPASNPSPVSQLIPVTDFGIPAEPEQSNQTHWLHQIEQDWLGLISRPLCAELAEAGWTPDAAGEYCPRCGRSVTSFELLSIEDDGEDTDEHPQGSRQDCSNCFRRRLPWEHFIRLGQYEGALRDAILETKFGRSRSTGLALGRMLGISLAARAASERIALDRILLVPVPMHPWRRLTRGIDHTLTISRGMQRVLPKATIACLLKRRGLRPMQTEIAPSARRANVRKTILPTGAIEALSGRQVIVLVDDVRTTGATLVESCRTVIAALKHDRGNGQTSVRVWAAAAAVAEARLDQNGS